MKILLIAYDFPPIPSPQAIRWAYLVSSLVRQGHCVDVLTGDVRGFGYGGLPTVDGRVRIHRVFAGMYPYLHSKLFEDPYMGEFVLQPMRQTCQDNEEITVASKSLRMQLHSFLRSDRKRQLLANKLALKRRSLSLIKKIFAVTLYPDERGEWSYFARGKVIRLLNSLNPDVVITSHEPANSLSLGFLAKKMGYRWVVDLGDPILAPYTPIRWQRKAAENEALVANHAHRIVMTNTNAIASYASRQPFVKDKALLITQGFPAAPNREAASRIPADFFDEDCLELLYTGTFYGFRRWDALLEAVASVEGARLTIATIHPTVELMEFARRHPKSIRLLGFVPHDMALELQRRSDVLVNVANDDAVQIPGKFYEYLGAGRPILHLAGSNDRLHSLIESLGVGLSVTNRKEAIARTVNDLVLRNKSDRLASLTGNRREDRILESSWDNLASHLIENLTSNNFNTD